MNFQYKQIPTNLLMAKQFVNTIYKQSKKQLTNRQAVLCNVYRQINCPTLINECVGKSRPHQRSKRFHAQQKRYYQNREQHSHQYLQQSLHG